MLGCAGGAAYAHFIESHWLALEQVRVEPEGLPFSLDGLRLGHLSDLHLGPHVAREHAARAVDRLLASEVDLILLTGDFVSRAAAAEDCGEELARLHAPLGVYACLGNHDHWTDPERVVGALRTAGIEVLRNRALEVEEGVWVAGVDDVWERHADLDVALEGVPEGGFTLLLAHEPEFADRAADSGRVALQLSGHTHGGQVRLPVLGPPVLPYLGRRYPAGLYTVDRMKLYVTRGVGLIAPAVRFNCRPEVTVLELCVRTAACATAPWRPAAPAPGD